MHKKSFENYIVYFYHCSYYLLRLRGHSIDINKLEELKESLDRLTITHMILPYTNASNRQRCS